MTGLPCMLVPSYLCAAASSVHRMPAVGKDLEAATSGAAIVPPDRRICGLPAQVQFSQYHHQTSTRRPHSTRLIPQPLQLEPPGKPRRDRCPCTQVFSGLAYCTASASMVLLNKLALSNFDFHSLTMLLIFQCTFCVVAVQLTALMGLIQLEVRLNLYRWHLQRLRSNAATNRQ